MNKININDPAAWRELDWNDPEPLNIRSDAVISHARTIRLYNEKRAIEGMSDETRKKISESKLGNIPYNKGISRDENTKQKISNSLLGKPSPKKGKPGKAQTKDSNIKRSNTQKGKKKSDITKERMRKPKSPEQKENMRKAWIKRREAKLAAQKSIEDSPPVAK